MTVSNVNIFLDAFNQRLRMEIIFMLYDVCGQIILKICTIII